MSQSHAGELLKSRRFSPFFFTQFFGAFNDNVFKNALVILVMYGSISWLGFSSNQIVNLAGGIFILPFFLFSATCGQIADKYDKSVIIRLSKFFEIIIVTLGSIGFYWHSINLLMLTLFLLGFQATLFGPVKYSIIPQHLHSSELVAGNALVETGTYIAILLGTIAGGLLISTNHHDPRYVVISLFAIALAGFLCCLKIPKAPANDPHLKLDWHIIRQTWLNIKFARENRAVFLAIIGISWFWFFGAIILAQMPSFTKIIIGGNEHVATLLLTFFCVGIGIGSMLCERLSRGSVEIGLVPFGAIGLSVFVIGIYIFSGHPHQGELITVKQFFHQQQHYYLMACFILTGIFSGFYNVPLYTLVQQRSHATHRSRIIAANNIINALFMVASALLGVICLKLGFSVPQIFLITAILNALISIYIYSLMPEFFMRFMVWLMLSMLYRIRRINLEQIPDQGGAVIICNHMSFIDALIITACCKRPIRFVMDHQIFKTPLLRFIFNSAKAIPIASAKDNPELKSQAFIDIEQALANGDLIGIFPEGKITHDGQLNTFRQGIEQIVAKSPVPVIPLAICDLWGSFFSRSGGRAFSGWPRKLWAKITVVAASPIPASDVSAPHLQTVVQQLLTNEQDK